MQRPFWPKLALAAQAGAEAKSTSHLQGIPRNHQGTVVLAAEGIQLQMCFSTVGHLDRRERVA